MPWIRKVWIFGDAPKYVSRDRSLIEHVPHEYTARAFGFDTPLTNFMQMFVAASAIPELAPEFVWFCDDFVCVDDVEFSCVKQYRRVENLDTVQDRGQGLWVQSLWQTYDLLSRLGYHGNNFETHAPTYFTKRRVFAAWKDLRDYVCNDRWSGVLGPTAILNHSMAQETIDVTDRDEEGLWIGFHDVEASFSSVAESCKGRCFLNFDDDAFRAGVREFLSKKFPVQSKFEGSPVKENAKRIAAPPSKAERVYSVAYPTVGFESRDELTRSLNREHIGATGALIGVGDGQYAERLLRKWKCRKLYCVDGWLDSTADDNHIDKNSGDQFKMNHIYNEARRRLNCFASRCEIQRMRPSDAASLHEDQSLAFVYVSEKHYFDAVWRNLEAWAPKVKSGGVLAGHDYLDGLLPSGIFEVKTAVDTWAKSRGYTLTCTGEQVWRSWVIRVS